MLRGYSGGAGKGAWTETTFIEKGADRVDHMQRARVHARHRVNASLISAGQTLPH